MQENGLKKSNPKKLRLIPNDEIREIISATHKAINEHGKRTKLADTILRLAHAYLDLSGTYKDIKKELKSVEHSHGSRRELLQNLIEELKGQMQGAAESVLAYESEIEELKKQNAGLLRRAQSMEKQNKSLMEKLSIKRQVDAVTGTPVKRLTQEEYDPKRDRLRGYEALREEHAPKKTLIKHSTQGWRDAKPNRDEERKAAAMRQQVANAGDETTQNILSLLGE